MKVGAVFTLILAVQASASFLDGFQSAFVSVENSFGKLLNDVVTDVKVTIDCTIVAVEKALSLGGLFGDHSKYERVCRGVNANNQPTAVQNTNLFTPKPVFDIVTAQSTKSEKQSVKREIDSSMANIHQTINNIITKPNPLDRLETLKITLKQDANRLNNEGSALTKQLDDISLNVKNEVGQVGRDSASTVDDVLNKINNLHKVTDEKSDSENSQIRHAFDEVMDAIHSNATKVHLVNDNTADKIMKDLEGTSNNTFTDIKTTYSQFRNEENKHLDDLKDIVESKTKKIDKTEPKEIKNEITKSFKTLAQHIMDEKMKEDQIKEKKTTEIVTAAPTTSTDGLETFKTTLKQYANRLDNEGSALTKQLDDISFNVINEVGQIGRSSATTVDDVLNKKYVLHKVTDEQSDSENSQIRHAFDEVKDAINSNATKVHLVNDNRVDDKIKGLEGTSNNSFTDIQTTYSQFKNEKNKNLDDLKGIVESKTKNLDKTEPKEIENEITKSFKTLAQHIMDEKTKEDQIKEEKTTQIITEAPTTSTDGLETFKTTLKQYANRLNNEGSALTKQLDDISLNVKNEVGQIGRNSASIVDDVFNKKNFLHKVTDEQSDSENLQIRHAFDEVMDAIHSNATKVHLVNEKTADKILKDLEGTSNNTITDIKTTYSQLRNKENKHLDDLKGIVESKTKNLDKKESKEIGNEVTKSLKTLAQHVMDGKTKEDQIKEEKTTEIVTEAPITSTVKPTKVEPTEDPEVLMFNSFFASNDQDAQETANEARSIIQRSRYSQMLMNNVLSSSDDVVSVFDNPDLLSYG